MSNTFIEYPSLNFDARETGAFIDTLVIHYTGMKSMEDALERLVDKKSKVSAHYLIDETGFVYKMVPEDKRAWHAGVSSWRGNTNINTRSIGIELVNPGHDFGYRNFPSLQMNSLTNLAKKILRRHPIPARNIIGHSDVAPSRKIDPGELFDWKGLASKGIGIWPEKFDEWAHANMDAKDCLKRIGYDTTDIKNAVCAFQRHFRPTEITGKIDNQTKIRIFVLCKELNEL